MRKFVAVKLEVQFSAHLEPEMEMVGSYQGVKRFSPKKGKIKIFKKYPKTLQKRNFAF